MMMAKHNTMTGTEAVQIPNPDDKLSIYSFIMKYQLQFTKYFGPSHAYGVTHASWSQSNDYERILATARVRPVYKSIKGNTCEFEVPFGKFQVWRKNVKLYDFIAVD